MTINIVIICLIFAAGTFLVLVSLLNARFVFGHEQQTAQHTGSTHENDVDDDNKDDEWVPVEEKVTPRGFMRVSGSVFDNFSPAKKRGLYLIVGIMFNILGVVAILTGFLNEKIDF